MMRGGHGPTKMVACHQLKCIRPCSHMYIPLCITTCGGYQQLHGCIQPCVHLYYVLTGDKNMGLENGSSTGTVGDRKDRGKKLKLSLKTTDDVHVSITS